MEVRARPAPDRSFWIALVLLVTAFVFGGGGSPAPLTEAIVQLVAVVAAAFAIAAGLQPAAVGRRYPLWSALLLCILAFPLVQIVPLPASWWQGLPGRESAAAALTVMGEQGRWRPWSLYPDGGLAAVLALLPAAVLALLNASLPSRQRVRLVGAVAALGSLAALLGTIQFIGGPGRSVSMYADVHRGWSIGFFANRNARARSGVTGPTIPLTPVLPLRGAGAAVAATVTGRGEAADTSSALPTGSTKAIAAPVIYPAGTATGGSKDMG